MLTVQVTALPLPVHTSLPLSLLHFAIFLRQLPYCQEAVKQDLTETREQPQSNMKSHAVLSSTCQEAAHRLQLHKLK